MNKTKIVAFCIVLFHLGATFFSGMFSMFLILSKNSGIVIWIIALMPVIVCIYNSANIVFTTKVGNGKNE